MICAPRDAGAYLSVLVCARPQQIAEPANEAARARTGAGRVPDAGLRGRLRSRVLRENFIAKRDALVADVDTGTCHKLPHLLSRLAAEGAVRIPGISPLPGHGGSIRASLPRDRRWFDAA